MLIVFQVLWVQTEQLCANIQTKKYRHFLLHCKPQNKTHLASETKPFTSNWAFSFVYVFRATCLRLNHQLPCFALEVLGCHQWRRFFLFFFGSQVNVFVSFSFRPNSFHYQSISETVNMHLDCGGALAPHCLEVNWHSPVQSGPSLRPDRHKDTWASDDAYGRSLVGVAVKASCAELGSVLLTDVPQLETNLEAAGAWPPPLTCDPQTLCQVCFGML